jgi:uncharacterized protein (DUF305 family)
MSHLPTREAHTIPPIEWDKTAIHYADPIGLCERLLEELHELGDELENRDPNDHDLDFIEGMIAAHTATLSMLGVDNIPVVGSNC